MKSNTGIFVFTAHLQRLCFYICLSAHRGEYLGRYPPGPGTPPGTRYTDGTRYTPVTRYTPLGPGTPPQGQVHPPDQIYPPGPSAPWEDTLPMSSACWVIQATRGRYACYWNAFLLERKPSLICVILNSK